MTANTLTGQAGLNFSTYDRDSSGNIQYITSNCGGWWHSKATYACPCPDPNGPYPTSYSQPGLPQYVMRWSTTVYSPLTFTSLSFRPEEWEWSCQVRSFTDHPKSVDIVVGQTISQTLFSVVGSSEVWAFRLFQVNDISCDQTREKVFTFRRFINYRCVIMLPPVKVWGNGVFKGLTSKIIACIITQVKAGCGRRLYTRYEWQCTWLIQFPTRYHPGCACAHLEDHLSPSE